MISVWVSPSAGEVVTGAVTVEAVADGVPDENTTVGCELSSVPSVVSVAVRVTVSAVSSSFSI